MRVDAAKTKRWLAGCLCACLGLSACAQETPEDPEAPMESQTLEAGEVERTGETWSLKQQEMGTFDPNAVRVLQPLVLPEYADRTLEEVLAQAEMVICGRIREVTYTVSEGGGSWMTALVEVSECLKGSAQPKDTLLFYKNQSFLPVEDYLKSLPANRRQSVQEILNPQEGETEPAWVQTVTTNDVMCEPGQRVVLALQPSPVSDLDGSWQAVPGTGSELYTIDREHWMVALAANSILNQSWDARRDYAGLVDGSMLEDYTLEQIRTLLQAQQDQESQSADESSAENPSSEEAPNSETVPPAEDETVQNETADL